MISVILKVGFRPAAYEAEARGTHIYSCRKHKYKEVFITQFLLLMWPKLKGLIQILKTPKQVRR